MNLPIEINPTISEEKWFLKAFTYCIENQDSVDAARFGNLISLYDDYKKIHSTKGHKISYTLFKKLIDVGIHNDELLWWYIWEYLGWKIPRKRLCEDHGPGYGCKAPFNYVADMFFERAGDCIVFANRTGGKTLDTAILNHLDMLFKDDCEVASAGATRDQADRMYTYFTKFHKTKELKNLLQKDPTRSASIYGNESMLSVITGSVKGLNSPHPNKARIDEVELMDWEVLQESFSMTMSKDDITAQQIFLCVTGDTLIDVPRNHEKYPDGIPIKELVGRKDLLVYSYSLEKNKFVLSKVKRIWKTKKDLVYKLAYSWATEENEEKKGFLEATSDHLIMMRDGSYKQLMELQPGDSLMPFPTRKIINGYHYIDLGRKTGGYSSVSTHWVPEYYYACGKSVGRWPIAGEHVHHKDFRKSNDDPSNLKMLSNSEHSRIHSNRPEHKKFMTQMGKEEGGPRLAEYNKKLWKEGTEEELGKLRKKASERSRKLWDEEYERMCLASKKGHTPEAAIKRSNSLKGQLAGEKNPMYGISYEDHPKGMLGKTHTPEYCKKISQRVTDWNIERGKEKLKELRSSFDLENLYLYEGFSLSKISILTGFTTFMIKKTLRQLGVSLRTRPEFSKLQWDFVDKEVFRIKKKIQAYYQHGNIKAAKEWEQRLITNHEVVSVEPVGIKEVYDMEVEGANNFVGNGIVLHNSTRKYDVGTFQRLLDESKKNKTAVYAWCIWEVIERCDRKCKGDKKHGDCPLWKYCKGIAHKADGFYKISDVVRKYNTMSEDTFEAQWLNKRPSREVLVYGKEWDEDFHMIDPVSFGEKMLVVSGIDFGSSPGHPFVYSKYYADVGALTAAVNNSQGSYDSEAIQSGILNMALITFYLFYEYRSAGDTMADHAEKIRNSPEYMEEELIFADPSSKQARIDLEQLYNIKTLPADNAVEDGIDMMRLHLRKDESKKAHYYVFNGYQDWTNPELRGTDWEFSNYKYPRSLEGRVIRRQPLKINDHGMDTSRYVVKSAPSFLLQYLIPVLDEVEQGGFWFESQSIAR